MTVEEDMTRLMIAKFTSGNVGLAPNLQTLKWMAQLEQIRDLPEAARS